VTVNCAGFPDGLFESEFFGHCRGAFTGAVESRTGLFEQSSHGTLFLDEVGELPLTQQAKLLTVLEEKRVRPVGASRARPVDARVVAATSRAIAAEVAAGAFRPDLYHRIALIRCELPPLRTRPDDLLLLTSHLLDGLSRKYRRPGLRLGDSARQRITDHSWPGNVRELSHVLEAAVILSGASTIEAEHLDGMLASGPERAGGAGARCAERKPVEGPTRLRTGGARSASPVPTGGEEEASARGARFSVETARRYSFFGTEEEERTEIRATLARCRGNKTQAARELGMARNTLAEKLRRYSLEG
jgi:two-component system response regulator PilR (NtrC family)